jgi:hypothetical protein
MINFVTGQVLDRLGVKEWALHGEPTNEAEFLEMFHKVVGVDPTNNHSIMSNDPADFGVTWSQIESTKQIMIDEWIATEYQRDRKPEYPPIGDQLDALWKGGDAATEMLAKVQAVKEKYPKPE